MSNRARAGRTSWRGLETLENRWLLAADPVISEFLASNDRTLDDEDGADSDYIEIHNAGDTDMSLDRWYLTDNSGNLRKWRFPAVDLEAGGYLVVFASGKDRHDPAGELHTNFSLSTRGEYLALVQPDGLTVAHEIKPSYPVQVQDVSYGIPTGVRSEIVVSANTPARIQVPRNGQLDVMDAETVAGTWVDPALDDRGWRVGTAGVGFLPSTEPVVIADSVADFSGVQGKNSWNYGTWARNFDTDKVYKPSEFATLAAARFFKADTNKWDLAPPGQQPSTEITPEGGHPSSAKVGPFTHWAIRRWTAEITADVTFSGQLGNPDPAGDGIVGRILVNGKEVFQQVVNGATIDYRVTTPVKQGDLVDFVIDPGAADDETGDTTIFTTVIRGVVPVTIPEEAVARSSVDWPKAGVQGTANWFYGIYEPTADLNGRYDQSDFIQFPADGWFNQRYFWPDGSVVTEIRAPSMLPHGNAQRTQWPIRRWQVPLDGSYSITYDVAKAAAGGDGVTARLFHNGKSIDSVLVGQGDTTGSTRRVVVEGMRQGDWIDFAIDPLGAGGDPLRPDGTTDRANTDVRIARLADLREGAATDLRAEMQGVASTAYLRIPFQLSDLRSLASVQLKARSNDGFKAYLNGHLVAEQNAPAIAGFDATATAARSVIDSTRTETFDLTQRRDVLVEGTNYLQVQVLNAARADDTLLFAPELVVGKSFIDRAGLRYFPRPTPGAANGAGVQEVGPLVVDVDHGPDAVTAGQPIRVTAQVARTFQDIADVTLHYRLQYEPLVSVAMQDDGTSGDAVAGDGTFTADIPTINAGPGQMVRWYVTARDTRQAMTRFPRYDEPLNYEEYLGTVFQDPTLVSRLPIVHLFIEDWSKAISLAGTRGSIYYDGEFYSNAYFGLHGQSTQSFKSQTTKLSLNVDLPVDHRFRLRDDIPRMKDFDLLTNFPDKSKLRNTLAYEQVGFTGAATHMAFPVRVQRNGEFYAVYDFVEQGDSRWLERIGRDPRNSLYKMYTEFATTTAAKKRSGPEGTIQDLRDIVAKRSDITYLYDHVNLAQMANFMASAVLHSGSDCCHKNYYAYHDTHGTNGKNGTDEWWMMAWDLDLTQGRYCCDNGYENDTMMYQRSAYRGSGKGGGGDNVLGNMFNYMPGFREMFLRRVRTLVDAYVKPPGTPREQLPLESRVDELYAQMKPDAEQDNLLHPASWGQTGFQSFDKAVGILLNDYSAKRREFIHATQFMSDPGDARRLISGTVGATTGAYFVPKDESLGRSWTGLGFNDGGWASGPLGIGVERKGASYRPLIATDVAGPMAGSTSLYVRIPFDLADPSSIDALTLRMKYREGYVAYLNGTEIARKGVSASLSPRFDSTAGSRLSDEEVIEVISESSTFDNVNVTKFLPLLRSGKNVLAIHAIDDAPGSNEMFLLPELVVANLPDGNGQLPPSQVGNPQVQIGVLEFAPVSGNQAEEYIQLVNPTSQSVDLTGWKIAGAVRKTLDPGTVLLPGATMYVAADARAFRARTSGPSGGQRLFVQGNYEGTLPNEGGLVQLVAVDGQVVGEKSYQGTVSPLKDKLAITEVMYHPLEASAAELAIDKSLVSDDFEFIELRNLSNTETLDLAGVRFTAGVEFDFTNSAITRLAPGEYALVASHRGAFAARYGAAKLARLAGVFAADTALRDSGELIRLEAPGGSLLAEFEYSDADLQGWPWAADGRGSSLQPVDLRADLGNAANWKASAEIHGSPGDAGLLQPPGIVIQELLSRSSIANGDWIEVHNPTSSPISLARFYLSDSSRNLDALRTYAFPSVVIPAGGYWTVPETQFNAGNAGVGLNALLGDQLYLSRQDEQGRWLLVDGVEFNGSVVDESFGRARVDRPWMEPQVRSTPGASNAGPRTGPLVVTEVMFAPASPSAAALGLDPLLTRDDLKYLEVYNRSASPVPLGKAMLAGGVDMGFPSDEALPPGQSLLVLSFDPLNPARPQRYPAFLKHYGLSEAAQGGGLRVAGGFQGMLARAGDGVRLLNQGTTVPLEPLVVPEFVLDQVVYETAGSWPTMPADGGRSLSRVTPAASGLLASGWTASTPTPGSYQPALVGDLNQDGVVDGADINRLQLAALRNETEYDLTGDGRVDTVDLRFLVVDVLGSAIGDVNVDKRFDSNDLVLLFQTNEYEDAIPGNSTYTDGDWNLDGDFTTSDLLVAWQEGGYEDDPSAARPVAAVSADDSLSQIAAALVSDDAWGTEGRRAVADWERSGTALGAGDGAIAAASKMLATQMNSEAAAHDLLFADWEEARLPGPESIEGCNGAGLETKAAVSHRRDFEV